MGVEDTSYQIPDLNANTTFYDWVVKENDEIIEKLNLLKVYGVAGSTGIDIVSVTGGTATFSIADTIPGITISGTLIIGGFIQTPDGGTHASLVTSVNGLTGAVTISGPTGNTGPAGATAPVQDPIFVSDNYLLNGNFDIWQRGTTFTSNPSLYFADKWNRFTSTSALAKISSSTISRGSFTAGQTDVLGSPTYYANINMTFSGITTGDFMGAENRIEGGDLFLGEDIAVDGYMKFDGVTGATLSIYLKRSPDGSTYTTEEFTDTVYVPGTTWTSFFVKHTPAASAASFTEDGYVAIGVKLNDTISGTTLSLANFRAFATQGGTLDNSPYREPTNPEEVLQKCSRFYQRSYSKDVLTGNTTMINSTEPDATAVRITDDPNGDKSYYNFPVKMRSTPSVTVYSPQSGTVTDGYNASSNLDLRLSSGTSGYGGTRVHTAGSATIGTTPRQEGIIFDILSGSVIFDTVFIHYVADADL